MRVPGGSRMSRTTGTRCSPWVKKATVKPGMVAPRPVQPCRALNMVRERDRHGPLEGMPGRCGLANRHEVGVVDGAKDDLTETAPHESWAMAGVGRQ